MEGVEGAKYEELVEVNVAGESTPRFGKVLDISKGRAVVQMFGNTSGMTADGARARFRGETLKLGVSEDMLGRVFNGAGEVADGGPELVPEQRLDIGGEPINPYSREFPDQLLSLR